MKALITVAAVATTLLAGCATEFQQGQNFDMSRAAGFQRGKTTRPEVIATMGQPSSSGSNADSSYIEYQYETVKVDTIASLTAMFRPTHNMGDNRVKLCRFWFDGRNVLKDYSCSEGMPNYQSLGK